MRFIGIDVGSSSIKAGILRLDDGAITDVRWRWFPDPIYGYPSRLPSGSFEVNTDQIVEIFSELLDELISIGDGVEGILTCCQMGGVVLTDARGAAETSYISWRDQRTSAKREGQSLSWIDQLRAFTTDDEWNRCGHELKPGAAVSLLYWLKQNSAIPKSAKTAMSLGEYVLARLCNSPALAEPTLALGTYDLRERTWHHAWFERLGFGDLAWPNLVSFDTVIGEYRGIPCYPAIGDHQAALFGAGIEPGELSINVSTGSQVAMLSDTWQPGDYQTRPFFGGKYLNTITHLPAGRALNGLVSLLTQLAALDEHDIEEPWPLIAKAVEATAGTSLEVNLAFFDSAIGGHGYIRNIRLEDLTIGHLFRAAFANMAENYAACAARLSPTRNWQRIVLTGGLPQELPALRDLIVGRFNSPYRMVDTPEETLQGLLHLARLILQS